MDVAYLGCSRGCERAARNMLEASLRDTAKSPERSVGESCVFGLLAETEGVVELPSYLLTAFAASLMCALASGLLSPYVVLRKASYASEAFAHIAFAGMAFAFLLDLPYGLVALLFVAAVAYLIGRASARFAFAEVNLTTIFLAVSMALGVLFLSMKEGYVPDIADYLFGNILLVADSDLIFLSLLIFCDIVWLSFFARPLYYISYNEEIAAVCRIPVRLVSVGFLVLLACNILVIVKIAGVILVTAGLVLPGATALFMTRNMRYALVFAVVISLAAAVSGFFLSLAADIPMGVAVVLIQFGVFIIALAGRGLKWRG
jgi:zinc transport system permease protein